MTDYENLLLDDQFINFMEDSVYKTFVPESNSDKLDCLHTRIKKEIKKNSFTTLDEKIQNFVTKYIVFGKMTNIEKELNYYMGEIMDHAHEITIKNNMDLAVKSFRMRYLYHQAKEAINNIYLSDDKKANMLHNLNFFMGKFEKMKKSYIQKI